MEIQLADCCGQKCFDQENVPRVWASMIGSWLEMTVIRFGRAEVNRQTDDWGPKSRGSIKSY